MKLIVGLGNPGLRYKNTRHNVGFWVADLFAKKLDLDFKRDSSAQNYLAQGQVLGNKFILAKPDTFMNLSGRAVSSLVKKYKIAHKDILVICDDLNLEPGEVKLKKEGSSGGHNGLGSIIDSLKTKEFARLKIGIGRPKYAEDFAEYVLEEFSRQEKKEIASAIEAASLCALAWLEQDLETVMNQFNKR